MRIVQFSVLLLLLSAGAQAANPTFTGSLRFVSPGAITVRLSNGIVIDARLPKTGDLSAEKLAGQYKLADQVQIACRNIQGGWDDSVKRFHSLELTGIHFVRAPSAEEVAQVGASLSWQVGENLLKPVPEAPKPPAARDPDGLARIREVNLARAAKMPNFVADELAIRSIRRKGDSKWKQLDTVESEIAFHAAGLVRQSIRINGKPYKTVSGWIPGANWDVSGFGGAFQSLFEHDCANTFERAGREELRGRQVGVFRFNTPLDGCFGPGVSGYRQYDSASTGRILVDETDGSMLEMEKKEVGAPAELGDWGHQTLWWDYVKIGDATHLLPVASDYSFVLADGVAWHIAVEYKNHRHFEASTNIKFEP